MLQLKTQDSIYIFEFKLNGTAEQALQQIDEKGYLIPYQVDGRELVKVGVEFSAEKRNIDRWLYQLDNHVVKGVTEPFEIVQAALVLRVVLLITCFKSKS